MPTARWVGYSRPNGHCERLGQTIRVAPRSSASYYPTSAPTLSTRMLRIINNISTTGTNRNQTP